MNFDIGKHTIYEVVHGSHAYGLARPESDLDIRGIAIPPSSYFFGFARAFEQHESKGRGEAPDLVIFDIRKFFKLAADSNPNVVELLWVPDDCHRLVTPIAERLIANRDLFLSKRAKHTFSGYAVSQLKRIKTHRRWLLSPPDHEPTRREFGLPETTLLAPDIMGAIASFETKDVDPARLFSSEVMSVYQRERAYHNAFREWKQYENWRATRNPARAALEAKFGYDTKHAMHLVRLMRMCREVLTTGQVVVRRPDREELLAVRAGAWSYDTLIEWAEEQDKEFEQLYVEGVVLPKVPPIQKLDELCEELVADFLQMKKGV